MLTNYLKIALRNLLRQKLSAFVTVVGLAVGMACCLLIFVFVRNEWTFDRFNSNAERIFRVIQHEKAMTREAHSFAATPIPLAPTLKATHPEIEQYCRVFANTTVVKIGDRIFNERIHIADPSLFAMFSFPMHFGNGIAILASPENVILTNSMATKLFGAENAIGKRLSLQGRESMKEYVVAGIAEDLPSNSSIRFEILLSFENAKEIFRPRALESWGNIIPETYIQLSEKASAQNLQENFTKTALLYYNKVFEQDLVQLRLQPLIDVHLNTAIEGGIEDKGNPTSATVLSGVALVILLVGCANFMIISLGRSIRRAKEVGVRKVFGAFSRNIRAQFIIEAFMISLFAIVLGVLLTELTLPFFNALTTLHLSLRFDALSVASIIFLALFAGIVAGGYPALLLSFLQPSDILKGSAKLTRTSRLRNALIVVQFAVSIVLMGAAIIMTRQLEYMQTKHPGFNKEQVIIIQTGLRPSDGASVYETFRNVASQRSDVLGVAGSAATVGGDIAKVGFTGDNGTYHEFYATTTDERFLPVMGIQLRAGRNFQTDIASDQYEAIIVNEAFVKHFGWQNPLAEKLPGKNFPLHRIVGVMKDFHFQSLHSAIAPMMFVMKVDSIGRGIENVDGGASLRSVNIISVRLAAGNMSATIAELEQLWKKIAPSKPFDYSFLNQELDKQYRHEERLGKLAGIAAVLAVSIACIGLFSLVALVMEQRTKEIGIRKVLGASVASIVGLLSKDFLKLVGIAIVVAMPLAWFGMSAWLQDFAYRVELSWWIFALTAVVSVAIAFMTVAAQTWRAAQANPIASLRSE